ncbi:hypothetical protein APV28_2162 [Comamonas testosteroni]|nr:hypothetical protein APV28_2162 [Comamonas testosteroni]
MQGRRGGCHPDIVAPCASPHAFVSRRHTACLARLPAFHARRSGTTSAWNCSAGRDEARAFTPLTASSAPDR